MTSPFGILGRALGTGPLGGLKRYLRWFNLTMLQQALWPLLIAVASAPQVDVEETPPGWFLLRLAGPVLAILLAIAYLRQRTASSASTPATSSAPPATPTAPPVTPNTLPDTPTAPPETPTAPHLTPNTLPVTPTAPPATPAAPPLTPNTPPVIQTAPPVTQNPPVTQKPPVIPSEVEGSLVRDPHANTTSAYRHTLAALVSPPAQVAFPAIARQFRYAIFALPIVVGLLRLLGGPVDEAARIIAFGVANVAAYHLIHFGVVPQLFSDRRQGLLAGVVLFGISWGLYSALMFGLTEDGNWLLGLAAGLLLGWFTGAVSLAIRAWPGGALTAAAVHFLVVYLIAAFV